MRVRFHLLLLAVLLSFPACSFAENFYGDDKVALKGGEVEELVMQPELKPPPSPKSGVARTTAIRDDAVPNNLPDYERKIIYTATVSLEVKKTEKAVESVKNVVEEFNGVIADSSVTELSDGRKSAKMIVKVPQDKFEQSLNRIADVGDVKSKRSYADDISEEYFDLELRLKNAKIMEERLVDLLKNKASKLKDMLEVERELGRVREKIERMEGRKRFFDQRVAMSTITLELYEPYKYTKSVFDPISKAINSAGEVFMESVGGVVVFVAATVPWLVVLIVGIYVVVFFVRRAKRRRKKRNVREERSEE